MCILYYNIKATACIIESLSEIGDNFHFKARQPLSMRLKEVCKFFCSCISLCIGQTSRNLLGRMKNMQLQINLNSAKDALASYPLCWF